MQRPWTGVAQTPTLANWGAYLEQHSALSTSPLSEELQRLLGPVTYTSGKQEELGFQPLVAETPYQERKAPKPLYLNLLGTQMAPVVGSP